MATWNLEDWKLLWLAQCCSGYHCRLPAKRWMEAVICLPKEMLLSRHMHKKDLRWGFSLCPFCHQSQVPSCQFLRRLFIRGQVVVHEQVSFFIAKGTPPILNGCTRKSVAQRTSDWTPLKKCCISASLISKADYPSTCAAHIEWCLAPILPCLFCPAEKEVCKMKPLIKAIDPTLLQQSECIGSYN